MACTLIAHRGMLSAAHYITTTVVDLVTQPAVLAQIQEEFRERTSRIQWRSLVPDGAQAPIYQPPGWYLRETNQPWPPPSIAWPPLRYVSYGQYGSIGPRM